MRRALSRIGATLALLSLSMQVVVCALGGRLCLRATAASAAATCASVCCGDSDRHATAEAAVIVSPVHRVRPAGTDCCLVPALEHLSEPSLRGSSVDGANLVPSPYCVATLPPRSDAPGTTAGSMPCETAAPPAQRVLRTTILRL